jgi:hypothetical protein
VLYALYEDAKYQKMIETETQRDYYPLDFRSAKTFHVIKVDDKTDESVTDPTIIFDENSVISRKGFEVVDNDGEIKYKFVRVKLTLRSQVWKMFEFHGSLVNKNHIALILINSRWSFFKKNIYFPTLRKNRPVVNSAQNRCASARSCSAISVPISAVSSDIQHSSPYIEPTIQNNLNVTRVQLCDLVRYNPYPTLHLPEEQRLNRVHVQYFYKYKTGFKIQKSSDFEYFWNPSGYLEKTIVQKDQYATERIGFMKVDDSLIKIHVNDKLIDIELAISSGFLQYILSYQ